MASKKSLSAVSGVIKNTMGAYDNGTCLIEKPITSEFTIKVANTREEREMVFRLAYQIYLEKGYVDKNKNEWLISSYDEDPETVILMVFDGDKKLSGSVTIIFDGENKLPMDKIFSDELNILRASGKKIAEISRLIISNQHRNSKEVLVKLFNYLALYVHHIKKFDLLAVEVNPRHKDYYRKLLCFEETGIIKLCPMVNNAPACFLALPIETYRTRLLYAHNPAPKDTKDRTLYPYFLKPEEEMAEGKRIQSEITPLTEEDKVYFEIVETILA